MNKSIKFPRRSNKRVSRKLKKYLLQHGLEDIYNDLRKGKNKNNYFDFSVSDLSKISYLKGDRIPEDCNLIYNTEYRKNKAYHGKIGKLLSDQINNESIKKISALMYNRALINDFNLIVTGRICHYYLEDNYSRDYGEGQLFSSCMRHLENQDSIELYETLGRETVELLVLLDKNDLVVARALLWHNVEKANYIDGEGPQYFDYLDRVYSANDNVQSLLYQWAESRNIPHYDNLCDLGRLYIKVNVPNVPIPYFDTFHYYDGTYLNNDNGDYQLTSTDGEYLEDSDGNNCTCGECGNRFDSEYHGGYSNYTGDYLCDDCGIWLEDSDCIMPISECVQIRGTWYSKENDDIVTDINGDYQHIDDVCYSEYHNDYLPSDDANYSEYHEDYFQSDDVIYSQFERDYLLSDHEDTIELNDDIYLRDNCVEIDGELFAPDDDNIVQDENGVYKVLQTN